MQKSLYTILSRGLRSQKYKGAIRDFCSDHLAYNFPEDLLDRIRVDRKLRQNRQSEIKRVREIICQ